MTLRELRRIGLGYLGLTVKDYEDMTFSDLELKYEGWNELRRADLFDRWEQCRTIAHYGLIQPSFKLGARGFVFENPYADKKPKKSEIISREEAERRVNRWKDLEFKEYGG